LLKLIDFFFLIDFFTVSIITTNLPQSGTSYNMRFWEFSDLEMELRHLPFNPSRPDSGPPIGDYQIGMQHCVRKEY